MATSNRLDYCFVMPLLKINLFYVIRAEWDSHGCFHSLPFWWHNCHISRLDCKMRAFMTQWLPWRSCDIVCRALRRLTVRIELQRRLLGNYESLIINNFVILSSDAWSGKQNLLGNSRSTLKLLRNASDFVSFYLFLLFGEREKKRKLKKWEKMTSKAGKAPPTSSSSFEKW